MQCFGGVDTTQSISPGGLGTPWLCKEPVCVQEWGVWMSGSRLQVHVASTARLRDGRGRVLALPSRQRGADPHDTTANVQLPAPETDTWKQLPNAPPGTRQLWKEEVDGC